MVKITNKPCVIFFAFLVLVFAISLMPVNRAEASLSLLSPANGARVAVNGNEEPTVVVAIQPSVYAYTQIAGQSVDLEWYVRMRVTCNDDQLYYSSFAFKSAARIEINLPIKRLGQYKLEIIEDRPVVTKTSTGFTASWHYPKVEDFLAATPDAVVEFTSYHATHTADGNTVTVKEATCEEAGSQAQHCTRCGEIVPETVQEIPAKQHDWNITYKWSNDNTTVTAEAVCQNDPSHKVTEEAAVKLSGDKLTATFRNDIFKKQEKDVSSSFVKVSQIKLNKTSATLLITASKKPSLQLKATLMPADATYKAVKWQSSNKAIATVDKNGKVSALKPGTVTINCTADDGSKVSASCKIVIKNTLVSKIKLSKRSVSLKKGATLQLKIKSITPAGAVNTKVKWTTSDKKVATVNKKGKVTAKGIGKCVITCTAQDGSKKTAACKITVK